jgi:HPt (histidine-containing phosphotransfer) domain-containing protein
MIYSSLLQEDPELEDLVLAFLEELPAYLDSIRNDFNNNNWDAMKAKVHDLKSLGGGHGYPVVSELAQKIESGILAQNPDRVAQLLNELIDIQPQLRCKP